MGNIAKRHKFILEQLKHDGYVKVQELSEKLEVSEVTIRKDLKYLESKKMLYRNHGSASSLSSIIADKHIDVKEKMQMEEKTRIAKAANSLLEPNDKIIIASGTTLLTLANEINVDHNITVITSSVKVSLTLCYNPNIEIVQLGGNMRKNSVSVIGHYAENILESLSCNKLFLGVDGIDLDYGLTTSDMSEARINQQMIDAAQKIIILTDSSKFGKRGFCKICDLNKIHHIITDTNAPAHIIDMLRERDIMVTLV
ncbi:DeoR/GlpR family DNA-binding transcription regulator [Dysgonomonas termitidis]|uniref:DeoR/GlpR family DNA-binding transcription regulator n=1 Tax=Dysgonomonas termitidis TaxID=1516126 RepID=A0ABV9KQ87_9BACT